MFCRSDDPVRDAEDYQQEQDSHPHVYCETCGERIYIESSTHDAEKFYSINGAFMCEECSHMWLEQQKVCPCL